MEHTSFRLVQKIEITLVELRHEIGQMSRGTQDACKRESLIPAKRTRYHVLIDRTATTRISTPVPRPSHGGRGN